MPVVGFAFNFNIQRCEIEVGDEQKIINDGYVPLLDMLLSNGMKADFFISGFSSKLMAEMKPDLLDAIRSNLDTSFELGTYTYTHPIPQLLVSDEFGRQMKRGLEIDEEIFGRRPVGFLPPEFAYTREMSEVMSDQGIRWTIALSSHLRKGDGSMTEAQSYLPYTVANAADPSLVAVPAVYQLPGTPQRFFKLMMKGQLAVSEVLEGVRRFADQFPDGILLFKRDAETVFIDYVNSGFDGTRQVMDEFLNGLAKIPGLRPSTIGEFLDHQQPAGAVSLQDYLGNTKLETFTEGEAQPLWDLTLSVREKLLQLEQKEPGSARVEKAWEHLLLSHNSDGRIGFWHSEWNPGEHTVAPSRRQFVLDNLHAAQELVDG